MTRYGFKIRTKTGQRIENIQIMDATADDAERRLRQMYVQCEIIERREQVVPARLETVNDSGGDISLVTRRRPGTH